MGLWAGVAGTATIRVMNSVRVRALPQLVARRSAVAVFALTTSALLAGLLMHAAGAGHAGNGAWLAAGVLGAGYALWAVAGALRGGRIGVDVIALLAVAGAVAVRELLAAAVIAVMLAMQSVLAGPGGQEAQR
jgi:hypothetical protein